MSGEPTDCPKRAKRAFKKAVIFTTEMSLPVCYVPTVNMLRCCCCCRSSQSSTCTFGNKPLSRGHPFFRYSDAVRFFLCCAALVHLSSIYKMWIKKCNLDFWLFFFLSSFDQEIRMHIARLRLNIGFVFFIRFLILMLKKNISRNHIAPHHIFLFKYHFGSICFFFLSSGWLVCVSHPFAYKLYKWNRFNNILFILSLSSLLWMLANSLEYNNDRNTIFEISERAKKPSTKSRGTKKNSIII